MKNGKLVKVAGMLDQLAKMLGGIAHVCGYVCLVFAVLVMIFGGRIFESASVSLDLDFIELHLTEGTQIDIGMIKLYACVGLTAAGALLFLIHYAMKLARGVFAPMKECRPFDEKVTGNLKKIAWISLIAGLVTQVAGIVERVFLTMAYPMGSIFVSEAIKDVEFVFTMDFSFVIVFCVLMLLSHVFAYGQQLQKESDETL